MIILIHCTTGKAGPLFLNFKTDCANHNFCPDKPANQWYMLITPDQILSRLLFLYLNMNLRLYLYAYLNPHFHLYPFRLLLL